MTSNKEIVPVEVFSGTLWEAEMVKSLLENEEIEAFLNDENAGWVQRGTSAVKVVVSSVDYDKAKLIVEEYERNNKEK